MRREEIACLNKLEIIMYSVLFVWLCEVDTIDVPSLTTRRKYRVFLVSLLDATAARLMIVCCDNNISRREADLCG